MYLFGREDDVCCVRWVAVVAVLAVLALHATIPIITPAPHTRPAVEHTGQEMAKCAAHIFYILFLLRLGPGVSFSLLQCIKHQYSSTVSTPLHSGKFREVVENQHAASAVCSVKQRAASNKWAIILPNTIPDTPIIGVTSHFNVSRSNPENSPLWHIVVALIEIRLHLSTIACPHHTCLGAPK